LRGLFKKTNGDQTGEPVDKGHNVRKRISQHGGGGVFFGGRLKTGGYQKEAPDQRKSQLGGGLQGTSPIEKERKGKTN